MVSSPQNDILRFSQFVDLFAKQKLQSSGFPNHCVSDRDRLNFVQEVFDNEGIQLDIDKIEFNAGLRSLSKTILNCLYGTNGDLACKCLVSLGKFFENEHRQTCELVYTSDRLRSLLQNEDIEVTQVELLNSTVASVCYKASNPKKANLLPYSCSVIASYCTAHARLELWEALNFYQDAICYYDTDGIIAIETKNSQHKIERSMSLGKSKDELPANTTIQRWCATSCKSYYFETISEDGKKSAELKSKGIVIDNEVHGLLTYENMKRLVDSYCALSFGGESVCDEIKVHQSQFFRHKNQFILTTENRTKRYRVTTPKRCLMLDGSYSTLPYGYID